MVICVASLSDTWGVYSCSWITTNNLIPWVKDYAYIQWVSNFSLINIKLIQMAENFTNIVPLVGMYFKFIDFCLHLSTGIVSKRDRKELTTIVHIHVEGLTSKKWYSY